MPEGAHAGLGARQPQAGRQTRVVCKSDSLRPARAVDRQGARGRLPHPAHRSPRLQRRPRRRTLLADQQAALRAVPLPRDPAGGDRVGQQRPRRRHARALHRAALHASSPPTTRPATSTRCRPTAATPGRCRTTTRSTAPTTPTWSPSSAAAPTPRRRRARRARTATASRTSGRASAATCSSKAPGVSADDVVVEAGDAVGRQRRTVGRRPREARRHLRRPGRRLRAPQRHRAARARARHLHPRDRRLPSRPVQDVLRRRLRRPDLRRGPRPDPELRGRRQRRLGPLPGLRRRLDRPTGTSRSTRSTAYSQVFRCCDSHHNTGGFSGTEQPRHADHHNNFYDNALGFTTDVFTAPGHPGFPQHGNVIENNNFYSNNFNPFRPDSRRRAVHRGAGRHRAVAGRRQRQHRAQQPLLRQLAPRHDAVRGPRRHRLRPAAGRHDDAGARLQPARASRRRTATGSPRQRHGRRTRRARSKPNGVDFWWDAFPGNTGNCWWGNKAAPGKTVIVVAVAAARTAPTARCRRPASARRSRPTRPSWSPAWPASPSPAIPTATRTPAPGRRRRRSPAAGEGGEATRRRPARSRRSSSSPPSAGWGSPTGSAMRTGGQLPDLADSAWPIAMPAEISPVVEATPVETRGR